MENNKISLVRPVEDRRSIANGTYSGTIAWAEVKEFECNFNENGKRTVLNIKVEVKDVNGEIVVLYIAPNLTWGKSGKMVKLLDDIDALPEPGEGLDLKALVGIPVKVMVENVGKDGETYSNIVRMKRDDEANGKDRKADNEIPPKKKPVKKRKAEDIVNDNDDNLDE